MDLRALLPLSALLLSATALAVPPFVAEPQAVEFSHRKEAFQPWSFDTGWMPQPGPKDLSTQPPIQVRFIGHLGGGMRADAAGEVMLGWSPWQHWAVGNPGAGSLAMNLGVELQTFMRVAITLPDGTPFQWEGELPGVKGFDYRFAGAETFTPFLLSGNEGAGQVLVSDAIQKTGLLSIPITPTLIPIPFLEVSGTVDVSAGGVLDLLLRDGQLVFPEGVLSQEEVPLELVPHSGAVHTSAVGYEATAVYSSILELEPSVTLHVGPLDWTLAAFPIPVPLAPIEEVWSFNEGVALPLEFALPRAEWFSVEESALLLGGGALDFGTGLEGEEVSRTVRITNVGTAILEVELAVSGEGYSLNSGEPLSLAPYGIAERVIILHRGAAPSQGLLAVSSNDPSGFSSLALSEKRDGFDAGSGAGPDGGTGSQPPADGGSSAAADGGMDVLLPAGCSAAGGAASLVPFGLVLLLGALRRSRER